MTPLWFQENVFSGQHVSGVHVVPYSFHVGRHSIVAKLVVQLREPDRTITLFCKKSAKNELPARSAAQWERDIASYRAEANFYAHVAPLLLSRGVALIRPFAVFQSESAGQCTPNLVANDTKDVQKCTDPLQFMLLLECIDTDSNESYVAVDCLELRDARQALRYLANLHASMWGQEELLATVCTNLWPIACWWTLPKRGEKELAQCIDIWPQMLANWQQVFEEDASLPATNDLKTLGERMVQHAAYISSCLHDATLKTLVHGDFKSANLFFEAQTRHVIAFDWQWSGVGLGVMDVANLLNTSVSMSLLHTDDQERELLQFYYDCLQERMQNLGTAFELHEMYPFSAFERHYTLATLEYARVLISNFWKHTTPQNCEAMTNKSNCGLGYRTIPHVVRMVRKLHQGLDRVNRERQT